MYYFIDIIIIYEKSSHTLNKNYFFKKKLEIKHSKSAIKKVNEEEIWFRVCNVTN